MSPETPTPFAARRRVHGEPNQAVSDRMLRLRGEEQPLNEKEVALNEFKSVSEGVIPSAPGGVRLFDEKRHVGSGVVAVPVVDVGEEAVGPRL